MKGNTIRWLAEENIEPVDQLARFALAEPMELDPSYGYTTEMLLNVGPLPELPEEGEAFWRERYRRALEVSPDVSWDGPAKSAGNGTVRQLRFNTTGGRRLGGWLGLPHDGEVRRLVIFGHGYGGQSEPQRIAYPDAAHLYWCYRGQGALSMFPDIPPVSKSHVLSGIEDKETYIHGHNASDLWCAVSALRSLFPDPELPLFYQGGSFGGGIGALGVPWDSRIKKAFLGLPSFGNHPLRLRMPCRGSGESVRLRWLELPEILENTLRWHDAAATIRYARQPITFTCALLDPNVPPPGQFSVWRAHPGPSRLLILPAGHFGYPGSTSVAPEVEREVDEFLR